MKPANRWSWRGPVGRAVRISLLLLCAAGCSSRSVIVHGEPRVVAEQDFRIEVVTAEHEDDSLTLRVERVGEQRIEQDYWKERAETLPTRPGDALTGDLQVASEYPYPFANSGSDTGWLGVVILGIYAIYYAVAGAIGAIGLAGNAFAAIVTVGKPFDGQHTTIERLQAVRRLSASAIIESGTTGERIDLGPQPADGWILTPEILKRLGGHGTEVLVRDENLSTTVTLGIPR